MDMVRMHHPNIDSGERVIEVPASSVPQHLMAGWQVSEEASLEEIAVQLLVDGGLSREDAERMVRAQPPQEGDQPPPKGEQQTSEAPAIAGASALPDESPRRRRVSKEGE